MATPTRIASPLAVPSTGGCEAAPLPDARASVSALLVSENAPTVAGMLTPGAVYARERVIAMFTPTAAATDTPPSDVSAFGVLCAPPSPLPPFFVEVLLP